MKKITLGLLGILLFSTMIFAASPDYGIANASQNIQVNVNGLFHAVTVANSNALANLQENINMLNQTDRNILNRLNNVSAIPVGNNTIVIQGMIPSYFFGFIPLQHKEQYEVMQAGVFSRVPSFWDFLWRDVNVTY